MFIYAEFKIINMFFKERRSKYKVLPGEAVTRHTEGHQLEWGSQTGPLWVLIPIQESSHKDVRILQATIYSSEHAHAHVENGPLRTLSGSLFLVFAVVACHARLVSYFHGRVCVCESLLTTNRAVSEQTRSVVICVWLPASRSHTRNVLIGFLTFFPSHVGEHNMQEEHTRRHAHTRASIVCAKGLCVCVCVCVCVWH